MGLLPAPPTLVSSSFCLPARERYAPRGPQGLPGVVVWAPAARLAARSPTRLSQPVSWGLYYWPGSAGPPGARAPRRARPWACAWSLRSQALPGCWWRREGSTARPIFGIPEEALNQDVWEGSPEETTCELKGLEWRREFQEEGAWMGKGGLACPENWRLPSAPRVQRLGEVGVGEGTSQTLEGPHARLRVWIIPKTIGVRKGRTEPVEYSSRPGPVQPGPGKGAMAQAKAWRSLGHLVQLPESRRECGPWIPPA